MLPCDPTDIQIVITVLAVYFTGDLSVDFREQIERIDASLLRLHRLSTLQVNLGNLCNLSCKHCHVQAGPDGNKIMTRDVMRKIIDFLSRHQGLCLDVTGGCPEMNPDFRYLIEKTQSLT